MRTQHLKNDCSKSNGSVLIRDESEELNEHHETLVRKIYIFVRR